MKYRGKYSLVENLLKTTTLLTETNIAPDRARLYVQGLRIAGNLDAPIPGDPLTDGSMDQGAIGEALVMEWLGNGENLNQYTASFEFADIAVGDTSLLGSSEDAAQPGLTFYSVKAMTQAGEFDAKQKLNPDGFCKDVEKYGLGIRPDQQEVCFNWGVYVVGLDEEAERVLITKFGPIDITCVRLGDNVVRGELTGRPGRPNRQPSPAKESGWICVSASKRPGKSRDNVDAGKLGDMEADWNGNRQIRTATDLASVMGITPELKLELHPYKGMKGNKPYDKGTGDLSGRNSAGNLVNPNRGRPGFTR